MTYLGTIKRVVQKLLGLVLVLMISWVMLEVLLRAGFDMLPARIQGDLQHVRVVPWKDRPLILPMPMQPSTRYQTVVAPGLVDYPVHWMDAKFTFTTINLWEHPVGLRTDPEPRWPIDIMAFGDSFTFCWTDVEDCWVQLLGSEYGWSVINAGQPGTGPGGQVSLIEDVGVPIEPAVVVWQWYSNDMHDDYVLAWLRQETPGLSSAPAADVVPTPQGFARYSAVYMLLDRYVLHPPQKVSPYEHNQWVSVANQRMLIGTNEYTHGASLSYPAIQYGWERNLEAYESGVQMLDSIGTQVVFVLIPTKEEAYESLLVDLLGEGYFVEASESRQRLLGVCAERGWHCIDMTPALQAATRDGETVFHARDFHLNASGNHVVARVINDYIESHQLLTLHDKPE